MGIVAAAVVGEVLLRGGEAGSAVPTKVPGNLERTVCVWGGGTRLSSWEPPFLGGPTCSTKHWSGPGPQRQGHLTTYMAPWELAA